jgi:replicative DNA helicase
MDDYTRLKLSKMKPEQRKEMLDFLLGMAVETGKAKSEQFKFVLMDEFTAEGKERLANWGKMQGFGSGYRAIDELTKGLVGGELTVVSGKTSYGKTTVAINIANKVALGGIPVLFVTLEMTKPEITGRFMNINGGETDDYTQVSTMIAFQVSDELDWQSIDGLIAKFVRDFGKGLIIIDHLHYFTRELDNVAEDLGRITKEFKKNAIRYDVPVILISHVRKAEKGKKEADIEDLRGSSLIAQDADIVLMVGRNPNYQQELKLKIFKNRNRGYDFANDEAHMFLDGITLLDENPEARRPAGGKYWNDTDALDDLSDLPEFGDTKKQEV